MVAVLQTRLVILSPTSNHPPPRQSPINPPRRPSIQTASLASDTTAAQPHLLLHSAAVAGTRVTAERATAEGSSPRSLVSGRAVVAAMEAEGGRGQATIGWR